MKRTHFALKWALFPLILVLCSCFAVARDVGASFLWSSATRGTTPAITTQVGKLTTVFGKKGFDLDALAVMSSTATNVPIVGYALTSRYRVANEAVITFGPALTSVQGAKPSFGVLLGVSLRF